VTKFKILVNVKFVLVDEENDILILNKI